MKKIKFAFPKSILGISGPDWIRRLKKMRAFKGHEFEDPGQTSEVASNVITKDNSVFNINPALSDPAEATVADTVGSFFWPRPSAAMYERYRMQFSI
ncbi:hypothetical protein [Flavobacterium sp.]|uniref:hypothetical protein n=1 Tax=Flavobacterium sp. TaxID=239 RepID=UPI004034425E